MPRALRIQFPGAVLHVGTRGNRRATVFHDHDDYALFEGLLVRVVRRFAWTPYVYCAMPNHYHLVLKLTATNLSAGMQLLNGRYAQLYNQRYSKTGHVFQGRFWSELVETQEQFEHVCAYVFANPERAGICAADATWPYRGGRLAPRDPFRLWLPPLRTASAAGAGAAA